MFFLSSIPLVSDWWPAEESITVTSLCHHTSWFTNLSECGYTAHCLRSILLLKYPVNHLLCEHHQTANKKTISTSTCTTVTLNRHAWCMVKHDQLQLVVSRGCTCTFKTVPQNCILWLWHCFTTKITHDLSNTVDREIFMLKIIGVKFSWLVSTAKSF